MPLDAPARHRLLLSLRSEAALGLRSTRRGVLDDLPPAVAGTEVPREQPVVELRRVETPQVGSPVRQPVAAKTLVPDVQTDPTGSVVSSMNFFEMPTVVSLPVLSTDAKRANLAALNDKKVSGCTKCRLSETRTQTVFGEGDVDASIFFIGEGPGEDEDRTGRPFVGRSGQLLEKMIIAMGLSRATVFIANIVKCRPPDNRVPMPDEVETCTPYLVQQLEVIRPKVIVTLGLPASKYMLSSPKITMGSVRGRWHDWRGIRLMPTYHPSYVLRNYTEATRAAVWSDLQQVMSEIGLAAPKAKR